MCKERHRAVGVHSLVVVGRRENLRDVGFRIATEWWGVSALSWRVLDQPEGYNR